MKFAVLMTCHNRVETTLECLAHLSAAAKGHDYDVYLNDDGSTDGTGARVAAAYPEVKIIQGSGSDYWCGGMRRAWSVAASSGVDCDGYLWLNDDTFLNAEAIKTLFSNPQLTGCILAGATSSPDGCRTTYAGRKRNGKLIEPSGKFEEVYIFNGNFVWVPREVFSIVGNFPDYFTHALGDFDYGYRAQEKGVHVYQLPKYIGTCNDFKKPLPWTDPTVGFFTRVKNLYSPKGGPEPSVFFRYNVEHFGLVRALRVWIQQHIHVCMPRFWSKKPRMDTERGRAIRAIRANPWIKWTGERPRITRMDTEGFERGKR